MHPDIFSFLYPIDGTDRGLYGFMSAGTEGVDTRPMAFMIRKTIRFILRK